MQIHRIECDAGEQVDGLAAVAAAAGRLVAEEKAHFRLCIGRVDVFEPALMLDRLDSLGASEQAHHRRVVYPAEGCREMRLGERHEPNERTRHDIAKVSIRLSIERG